MLIPRSMTGMSARARSTPHHGSRPGPGSPRSRLRAAGAAQGGVRPGRAVGGLPARPRHDGAGRARRGVAPRRGPLAVGGEPGPVRGRRGPRPDPPHRRGGPRDGRSRRHRRRPPRPWGPRGHVRRRRAGGAARRAAPRAARRRAAAPRAPPPEPAALALARLSAEYLEVVASGSRRPVVDVADRRGWDIERTRRDAGPGPRPGPAGRRRPREGRRRAVRRGRAAAGPLSGPGRRRTTSRRPHQVASIAQTLSSTRPAATPTSRTTSSVISVGTPEARLGHATQSPPSGRMAAWARGSRRCRSARRRANSTTTAARGHPRRKDTISGSTRRGSSRWGQWPTPATGRSRRSPRKCSAWEAWTSGRMHPSRSP